MSQRLAGNTNRQRLRNACFTVNNPIVTREQFLSDLIQSDKCTYIVIGSETGAKGTPHFQGYVEFKDQIDFHIAKDLLLHGHIEPRRGSPKQASDYCQKDGDFDIWGTLNRPGERTDIQCVAEMAKMQCSMREIAHTYPVQFIKYHKGISALASQMVKARCTRPEVRVFYGKTGTGKSFKAREWLPNAYIWHPQQNQWFDGYMGEQDVILEEFRGQLPFGMILSMLDCYDCKVQFKGGVVEFCATRIAITSPLHPRDWYWTLDENDKVDQLMRRITEVIHL